MQQQTTSFLIVYLSRKVIRAIYRKQLIWWTNKFFDICDSLLCFYFLLFSCSICTIDLCGNLTQFVLQEENPSRESTIVRTAGKLTPFGFNRIPELGNVNDHLASKRRQKKYNLKPDESVPTESYCHICNSPLKKSNISSLNGYFHDGETSDEIYVEACTSCQYQILPKDNSSLGDFLSLFPPSITTLAKDTRENQKLLRWCFIPTFWFYAWRFKLFYISLITLLN